MLEDIRKGFVKKGQDFSEKNAYVGLMLEAKDGTLVHRDLGKGPCHGALQTYQLRDKGVMLPIKYILSTIQAHDYPKKDVLFYIDWLINKSPWACVFVDKDAESVYQYGWLIGTDHSSNLVASACIATRYFTETYTPEISRRFSTYLHILTLGFSEHESMLMSYLFEKDNTKKYSVTFRSLEGGHSVFGLNRAPESYYRNFLKNTPAGLRKNTFEKAQGYDNGVHVLWAYSRSEAFFNWIKRVRPIQSISKKSLNIFEKIKVDTFTITSEEGFKSVIEQILGRINSAQ